LSYDWRIAFWDLKGETIQTHILELNMQLSGKPTKYTQALHATHSNT